MRGRILKKFKIYLTFAFLCLSGGLLSACSQLENPKPEPFYAETAPPLKKEFRWSNGKMPKSFDPALASAPPETDIVRAVYEGLTEVDSKSLQPVPAAATDWQSSEDFKIWTFNLRRDARWSNGERVTAQDFERSWKRLTTLGEKVTHRELLRNVVGLNSAEDASSSPNEDSTVFSKQSFNQNQPAPDMQSDSNSSVTAPTKEESSETNARIQPKRNVKKTTEQPFGVEAVNDYTLKVTLINPDKDFPALVAHPIFRPIYGDGKNFETNRLNADIVTNGAFRVFSIGQDGITLDRAENYWNKDSVELERVRFVPTENAEKALEAYRAGELDAVTNADFEPLALKLLTPYEDFRRTTYSAINFYEFNRKIPPFDDRRVREALAIAIERERLTEDEMDGASNPALNFLPFEKTGEIKLAQDVPRAKNLLAESGYPNGENFPIVKLLVNRNNVQQRIARSVAKMWKQNLNIETEIVVKDSNELATAWATGEYTLLRRGVVLATNDVTANMMAIFETQQNAQNTGNENTQENLETHSTDENLNADSSTASSDPARTEKENPAPSLDENAASGISDQPILTEAQVISELPAIPLYFPTSYSLVKPYVEGFNINVLDAPSLKDVKINNDWQPKKAKSES